MRRSISLFGTYSVNEEKKTVIFLSSTYPNFAGEAQERTIDQLTADESECGGRARSRDKYL
jgi:hypothetical protein